MGHLGIDCYSPLTHTQAEIAKREGFSFVGRYLVPRKSYDKALTAAEAHAISSAGLGLLCVWETTDNRAKEGARAGKFDGQIARECAGNIGMPVDRGIIYFAVDFGAGVKDFPAIGDYLTAAAIEAAPYRIGVYGSYFVVEAMAKLGICSGYWQCVAWSSGLISPHMTVYQSDWSGTKSALTAASKIGVSVDINKCENLEKAGIWMYKEDEQMEINRILETMSDEQAARIVEKAQNYFVKMPLPGSWDAEGELNAAIKMGITDGTRPMNLATRLETAAMIKRAVERQEGGEAEDAYCEECDVEKILAEMDKNATNTRKTLRT